jgi:hypothetical protein
MKVRLTATYLGGDRPVTAAETDLILKYGQALRLDVTAYASLFKESYAFEAEGHRYWLPVQGTVAAFFRKS